MNRKKIVLSILILIVGYIVYAGEPAGGGAWPQRILPQPALETILAQFKNHELKEQLIRALALRTSLAHVAPVNSVAFSPDGKQIASGLWNAVRLWNLTADLEHASIKTFQTDAFVSSIAYSPNNAQLASGSHDTIDIWNPAAEEAHALIRTFPGGVNSVAYSPDGKQLAAGSADRTIKIWNLVADQAHALIKTLRGHQGGVNSVAYSPDGKQLASGSADRTIKIWNSVNAVYSMIRTYNVGSMVKAVAYSPDGRVLAAGLSNGEIKFLNPSAGPEDALIRTLLGHTAAVSSIAFSPTENQFASGSQDRTIKIWDFSKVSIEVLTLHGHLRGVNSVAYSPDGKYLAAGSSDDRITLWNIKDATQIFRWFNVGVPLPNVFTFVEQNKRFKINTNPMVVVAILNGLSNAIKNKNKFAPTKRERAYLEHLIFPQFPQSAVDMLKKHLSELPPVMPPSPQPQYLPEPSQPPQVMPPSPQPQGWLEWIADMFGG